MTEKEIYFMDDKSTKRIEQRLSILTEFITAFIRKHSYAPTVREMMDVVSVSSTATMQYYLDKLEERGIIRKSPNKKRTIELISKVSKIEDVQPESQKIPYIGGVTAGIPIYAEENYIDTYMVSKNLFNGDDLFILRIIGDSMINAGIFDGDRIVVRKQDYANNGDIVVAFLDGNATVKTFYKMQNTFKLQPQNPIYEPIITNELTILGKVIGSIRNFK